MKLTKNGGAYVFECEYGQQAPAKAARFRWDPSNKWWWTPDLDKAAKLVKWADETCRDELEAHNAAVNAEVEKSRATDADIDVPAPEGLAYLPFQRAGVAYALDKEAVIIGDEMGLGKTIQAIGVMNSTDMARAMVICPASLKINWKRELEKWLCRMPPMFVHVADGKTCCPAAGRFVMVINYDILKKHKDVLQSIEWDLIVIDEAQYLKSPDAQRTRMVFGHYDRKKKKQVVEKLRAKRWLALTGTPIRNRPVELWPILHGLDPETWPNFFAYAKRYCGAYQGRFGWDFTGASNLDDLQKKLRATIMIRRLKEDVLAELPPKRRQVIEIDAEGFEDLVEEERRAYEQYREDERMRRSLRESCEDDDEYTRAVKSLVGTTVAFEQVSRARHALSVAKVPKVAEHIEQTLESVDKVVVFAHHHDVVDGLAERLYDYDAVTLTGRDSSEQKDAAVRAFQEGKARVFIGNIIAAGTGLTLTASSTVLFAELDWVPGNVSQAEDRCHRIGQRDSVNVQHLVVEGSLDATMAQRIIAKQAVIDAALDDEHEENPVYSTDIESIPRKEYDPLTPEQIEAIHLGLKMLAGVCDGACDRDDMGFNGADTGPGKRLASLPSLTLGQAHYGKKILPKYHRQIGADLIAQIKGEESCSTTS